MKKIIKMAIMAIIGYVAGATILDHFKRKEAEKKGDLGLYFDKKKIEKVVMAFSKVSKFRLKNLNLESSEEFSKLLKNYREIVEEEVKNSSSWAELQKNVSKKVYIFLETNPEISEIFY